MSGKSDDQGAIAAEKAPHYHGHRARLRQRFLEVGSEAVSDYELLELILAVGARRLQLLTGVRAHLAELLKPRALLRRQFLNVRQVIEFLVDFIRTPQQLANPFCLGVRFLCLGLQRIELFALRLSQVAARDHVVFRATPLMTNHAQIDFEEQTSP